MITNIELYPQQLPSPASPSLWGRASSFKKESTLKHSLTTNMCSKVESSALQLHHCLDVYLRLVFVTSNRA